MSATAEGLRQIKIERRNLALGAACIVAGLLASSSAYADPGDAAADNDQLAEIAVTAQRHEENAQKVPISVAPIRSEERRVGKEC